MITKKFNKTYDDALTQAFIFHGEFVTDQARFEAFSSKFGITYADDFMDLITIADDTRTNQDDLNMQTSITNDLDLKFESDKLHYQKLLLHVEFAWPGDDTKQKSFGKNNYDEARRVPAKMVNLLQNAYYVANLPENKTALIAAGFVEADITLLDTLADSLQNKLTEQQTFIWESTSRAEKRAIAFNNVWDYMSQISAASKLIFTDSPARVGLYMLYPEGPGPGSLTAPTDLSVDVSTMTFSVTPVPNAVSYQFEMAVAGSQDFEVIYTGPDNYFIYTPPVSGLASYRARCHNSGGYSDYSNLMVYNYVEPVLPAPGYISLTVVNAQSGAIAINWESVEGASFFRLFSSQVAIGAEEPAAGLYTLVGEYTTAAYSGTVSTGYRYWFYVISGSSEEMLSVPSQSIYVDMQLIP